MTCESSNSTGKNLSCMNLAHLSQTDLPSVIIFALDNTLWTPSMDEIGNSGGGLPIVSHNNGEYVSERTGREIHLLPEVRSVLKDIV